MRITRVLTSKDGWEIIKEDDFDLKLLPEKDQIRVGFERGVLSKVVMTLQHDQTLTYEKIEDVQAPRIPPGKTQLVPKG